MANPFRRKHPQPTTPTIQAAAVNIGERGITAWKTRASEDSWQREAWYQYDICGEMRYALNWIANAISMASLYAADVDPETGLAIEPTENPTVQTITNTILGGPSRRSQQQALIALNYQVAGELFLLIRPGRTRQGEKQPDEWIVLSSTEIKEQAGRFKYCDPLTGEQTPVTPADLFIRVWSPHPRAQSHADSAVRAALPTLREIEKTSQNIASRLDSRLAGAGLLLIPDTLDFPTGDDEPSNAQGFMDFLARAFEAGIRNPGDASAQVPIIAQAPTDDITNVTHLDFSTDLSQEIVDLRTAAIRRLALALDMPAEIMLGMGESNHWSAWQIEEAAYKIHVAPLLDRLADALTTEYLHPALQLAGINNPHDYTLTFDTTDIITRPNRQEEMLALYDRRLVSDAFMRAESGVPDTAIPDPEEINRRFFEQLVGQAPTLVTEQPAIAQALGLNPEAAAQEAAGGADQVDAPDAGNPALPSRRTQTQESNPPDEGLTAAAELIVFDALSRAGGRLLTRQYRGKFGNTPKVELHTVIPVDDPHRLLEGSFQFVDHVATAFNISPTTLETALRGYVHDRLTTHTPHTTTDLKEALQWHLQ